MLAFTYLIDLARGTTSGTISALSMKDAETILRQRYPDAKLIVAVPFLDW